MSTLNKTEKVLQHSLLELLKSTGLPSGRQKHAPIAVADAIHNLGTGTAAFGRLKGAVNAEGREKTFVALVISKLPEIVKQIDATDRWPSLAKEMVNPESGTTPEYLQKLLTEVVKLTDGTATQHHAPHALVEALAAVFALAEFKELLTIQVPNTHGGTPTQITLMADVLLTFYNGLSAADQAMFQGNETKFDTAWQEFIDLRP